MLSNKTNLSLLFLFVVFLVVSTMQLGKSRKTIEVINAQHNQTSHLMNGAHQKPEDLMQIGADRPLNLDREAQDSLLHPSSLEAVVKP